MDGEMERQNGEIEHHMEHQNGEMEHQNEEMEHQNGEMDWFGYTPGCKRLTQPPGCNSTTTRMLSEVLISYTAGDDDDTEDDDDVDDGYVMLPLCSQLSPHSHFVYSPAFCGYMKKIEEQM